MAYKNLLKAGLRHEKKIRRIVLLTLLIVLIGIAVYRNNRSLQSVFDGIYTEGKWGEDDSGRGWSGPGSQADFTREYVGFIENFIVENNIRSVIDAGCGDWTFSKDINWHGAEYLGIDISEIAIDRAKQYESDRVKFMLGDITEILPPADLLLCKDVLQHLPNDLINKFIVNNLSVGKYRWAIITNDLLESGGNRDIDAGGYRRIDLSKPPFNLKNLIILPIIFGDDRSNLWNKTAQILQLSD